jgi:hypothetical protein
MNIKISIKQQMASAGLVLALASGGCAMMAPKGERYVAPPIGSTFTQTYRNTGSYGSGTRTATTQVAERTWEGKQYLAFVGPTGTILANPVTGAWSTLLAPDGSPAISFDPPAGYDYPLVVDKTWGRSVRQTLHKANKTLQNEVKYKVEAYEDVTVPAGTFKAFKIRQQWFLNSKLGADNINWYVPELGIFVKQLQTRTADSAYGSGTQEVEVISQTITK